jgi:hypothetical protein
MIFKIKKISPGWGWVRLALFLIVGFFAVSVERRLRNADLGRFGHILVENGGEDASIVRGTLHNARNLDLSVVFG